MSSTCWITMLALTGYVEGDFRGCEQVLGARSYHQKKGDDDYHQSPPSAQRNQRPAARGNCADLARDRCGSRDQCDRVSRIWRFLLRWWRSQMAARERR